MDTEDVLQFIVSAWQDRAHQCVLVTVGAVEGSSMRGPGTIMAVAEDGAFAGSLSGGCIENAVVAEALDALKCGQHRVVRFGAGSPYLDIRLPCGGGLDLHFAPLANADLAADCLDDHRNRSPFSLVIGPDGAAHLPQWHAPQFDPATGEGVFGHWPAPRLQIVGHGAAVEALTRLAQTMGCCTSVLSPDQRIVEILKSEKMDAQWIERRTQTDLLNGDPWTAIIFLFHDHDWEIELMQCALELPHFYLGAMGGRRAHDARCDALCARGVTQEQLETIHAPIGLFHSSRDPQTLALSTLGEVIRAYHATDFAAGAD